MKYDVIIMSYDIIRNDIDELSAITWNYCILDEGHIIKNGRRKVTKAIKTVKSNHRLILSGTPIQVNIKSSMSTFISKILTLVIEQCAGIMVIV